MRYYFIAQDEEVVLDITQVKKLAPKLYSFEVSHIKDNTVLEKREIYLRNLAQKFYLSQDGKKWQKVSPLNFRGDFLYVNRHFKIHRGYLPSGMGAEDAGALVTQMPGKVVKILVSEGSNVGPGDPLLVLEAMKMENEMKSALQGKVKAIYVKEGDPVEQGVLLMEIEAED